MNKVVLFCLCVPALFWFAGQAPAKELTTLRVVVEDQEGEPVERASVIVRRLKNNTKKVKVRGESLQLKTSQTGSAPLPPLVQGRYLLQVISPGFQTYGGEMVLNQSEQTVTITLQPPSEQFSVHTDPDAP